MLDTSKEMQEMAMQPLQSIFKEKEKIEFNFQELKNLRKRMNLKEIVTMAQENVSFCICFILFYPRIITRIEFISLLNELDQAGKFSILAIWLRIYPDDFKTKIVQDFFYSCCCNRTRIFYEFQQIYNTKQYSQSTECLGIFNNVNGIVRQMCSIESSIFQKIKPRDYFSQDLNEILKENILYFNRLAAWVVTLVLKEETIRLRAKTILYFMQVCIELRRVGNFNSLFGIISALTSSSLNRLKETNKIISRKIPRKYKELEKLTSPEKSWGNYRSVLKQSSRPAIPFLGVFTRDFAVLNEFKDKFHDGYNVQKLVKISEIVLLLTDLRSDEFTRVNHGILMNLLCQSEIYDEELAYKISCKLEQ